MGVELGSSEWKKDSTSPGLGKQQQVKNARPNKAVLRTLEKRSMDDNERDGLFVLGMDWIGKLILSFFFLYIIYIIHN